MNKSEVGKILGELDGHSVTFYEMATPKDTNFFKSGESNLICDNKQSKRLSLPGGLNAGTVTYCISNLKIAKKAFQTWPIIICLLIIIAILALSTFTPISAYKSHLNVILEYLEHLRDKPEVRTKLLKSSNITLQQNGKNVKVSNKKLKQLLNEYTHYGI